MGLGFGLTLWTECLACIFADLKPQRLLGLCFRVGMHFPVFIRYEGTDFAFTFDDQAHGNGLYPSGREATGDLLPQQR